MIQFISNEINNSDNFVHSYQCDSNDELANAVSKVMIDRGYKLIDGNIANGVYEKGNRTLRLLFGAFSKYYKFNISIQEMKVKFSSGSSGFSGGVIGIGQIRKETGEISDAFKVLK